MPRGESPRSSGESPRSVGVDPLPYHVCLCREDIVNLSMMKDYVEKCLVGIEYECHLMHYNYWEGVDIYFPKYTAERLSFNSKQDYLLYIDMIQRFHKQVAPHFASTIIIINVSRHENAIHKGSHPHCHTEAVLDGS